ncbi:MAG: cysteine-rich CWC family protein [Bacteroidales bacterium]|nr:cysteine-rich CWC family protein [Bacteroidales bacterium]
MMDETLHPKYETTICPRCDRNFTCLKSPLCWCMEYTLPAEILDGLELIYEGCLCKSCIEKIILDFDFKKRINTYYNNYGK